MITFRWSHLLSSLIVFCVLVNSTAYSQQTPKKPQDKDLCHVTVEESVWGDDGSLVLRIRIHAPASKGVNLFHGSLYSSDKETKYTPFTLAESYLLDAYTGAKIGALGRLPDSPHLGTMGTAMPLPAGSWLELSVAFPPPPPPPTDREGRPQPYKLTLVIPLDAPPIAIIPPPK